jgi:excinuclease ABC subunit C
VLAAEVLDRVPTDPGVYLFKDSRAKVVYVGKAKNLRTRVRQYFRPGGDERFFVAAGFLGKAVVDIETIVVTAEKEALLLENHLIKQHQPRFNVKLRDDKQYLVLRLKKPEPASDEKPALFPRVEVVRNIRDDSAHYFGPYHSATSARQTLRVLNRHFQLRTCTDHVLSTRGKPCLQYQIKRCSAPCALDVTPQSYADQVDDVMMFLGGKDKELVARLQNRMMARADAEDFENAAMLRDSISAVERTLARQDIVQDDFIDQDVWGIHRSADVVEVAVLFVRAGKLVGRRAFHQKDQELPTPAVIAEHVQLYYATGTFIPDEVVLGVDLEDTELLTEWLSSARGRKVKIVEPRRGTRARLVELADKNAAASAASRRGNDREAETLLAKVQERLSLARLPRRIECFDIAHIQGTETVASMVTFVDGQPAKPLYRKFKVRTSGNDDFASMYEVLSRRFRRSMHNGRLRRRDSDEGDDTAVAVEAIDETRALLGLEGEEASAEAAGDDVIPEVANEADSDAAAGGDADLAGSEPDVSDSDDDDVQAEDSNDADADESDDYSDEDSDDADENAEPDEPAASAASDDIGRHQPIARPRPRHVPRGRLETSTDVSDRSAWEPPDLLVIDGGKGQLGMALAALRDLGIPIGERGVDVVGLAKERELESGDAPDRIYRPSVKDPIQLRPNSPELYLLARLRDEAHRFANTFHQQRRGKATLRSELEDIPGVGATRRRSLLRHFGSVRAIRAATIDELARAPGMTKVAAAAVHAFFAATDSAAPTDPNDHLDHDELTAAPTASTGAEPLGPHGSASSAVPSRARAPRRSRPAKPLG